MKINKDDIKPKVIPTRDIDAIDRRLLRELVEDATLSYAELGEKVALSAPAAHERVKRLRRDGVIRKTAALLDPVAIKKNLLAFVHVDTSGWGVSSELMEITRNSDVEEVHSVAGDTAMILKIRTEDAQSLEKLLFQLYAVPGVSSTRSYIVLSTYLERPVQPGDS
ncbi:Lrp/AsnC family transcriptional regulator [Pectobacterium actinidiae]|uniref:Lrp/AsnC family transcriptional regulator n=1 Tax=Pectobacterium actinidiae TaxID=1507808 RepID=UPI00404077CC